MSFSQKEKGRSPRKSSVSQDGFPGALSMQRTSARGVPEVRQAPGPSRLQAVASHRQRALQRKPPEPLRRAVADCLSASHHGISSAFTSEAVRTLQDYLANASTIDIGYTVLLEHALAERDRSPSVVAKCVALLKRYLFRYIPQIQTLQQIDLFCVNLIAECNAVANKKTSPWIQSVNNQRAASNISANSFPPSSTSVAFASGGLVKSLNYVRALVARHIPKHSFQSALYAGNFRAPSKRFSPTLSSLRSRSFSSQLGPGGIVSRGSPENKESAKSAVMNILGLETIDEDDLNYIAVNILQWQWIGGKHQQSWTPSPVMTDSGGIARPQVESKYDFLEHGAAALLVKGTEQKQKRQQGKNGDRRLSSEVHGEQLLKPSTVTTVTDTAFARSHLRAIAASKRIKTGSYQVWDDVPVSTWRRRPRPLFQYRYYSEQQPLRLSAVEVEEVIAAVCSEGAVANANTTAMPSLLSNQTGRLAVEAADVAASVLIKLVIDMYMADSRTAAPLTLSMLEGMLSSSPLTARTRAFDLVLNLGIHAHLLEPMLSEVQSAVGEEPHSQSANFNDGEQFFSHAKGNLKSYEKVENGTPQAVAEFEIWLLNILYEILVFLVQIEEKEEAVWASALSCLMYMICDRGRIQRCRLNGLDIRVLKVFLEISRENSWAEELHCRLICLLANLLYDIPSSTDKANPGALVFNMQRLELLGGIEFICQEYARANAVEAKHNLFGVLFEYALYDLNKKYLASGTALPNFDEIQAVATVLTLADAPEAFAVAFKQGLHGVGGELTKSIVTAMSRDVNSGRLNAVLLEDVDGSLDAIVETYTHSDDEFSEMIHITMMHEGLTHTQKSPGDWKTLVDGNYVSQAWTTLDSLLHSPRAIYRQNGYFWLIELLFAEMIRGSARKSNRLNIQNLQQQLGLLGSSEKSGLDHLDDQSSTLVSSPVRLLCGLLKSKYNYVRWGFIFVLERLLLRCQQSLLDDNISVDREFRQGIGKSSYSQEEANAVIGLMNGALWQIFLANETDRINILKMCDLLFSQLCLRIPLSLASSIPNNSYFGVNGFSDSVSNSTVPVDKLDSLFFITEPGERHPGDDRHTDRCGFWSGLQPSDCKSTSMAALLLRGYAAAPRQLVACVPTALLYWPLIQLAGAATDDMALGVAVGSKGRGNIVGGASDTRAALLLLLIGKCTTNLSAFQEVGGEEFFRSLLDDTDARVAYYTSAFLLKRMMTEEPEKYQRMLHNLVFKAQQSNNEKLLENPYLQMRGILQLSSDLGGQLSFQES